MQAGSPVGLTARIDEMMSAAHGEPVLWVSTRTELSAGPWANAGEQAWDRALDQALARYPNMKIFNWSAVARPAWFLDDGIHYTTVGCAIRRPRHRGRPGPRLPGPRLRSRPRRHLGDCRTKALRRRLRPVRASCGWPELTMWSGRNGATMIAQACAAPATRDLA